MCALFTCVTVLLSTSLAAMWCNIMPPTRPATGCSDSFVLSSESSAAVACRDIRNVFYLRTVVFQNLLDELFSPSGTSVAFFRHSRSVLLSLASVLQVGILVCARYKRAAYSHHQLFFRARHTKRCSSLV